MRKENNKNSIFILPMFKRSKEFYTGHFENVYLDNEQNVIYFVFKNKPEKKVVDFITSIEGFLDIERLNNKYIYKTIVPYEFERDFDLYKKGKYSKLSKGLKLSILAMNPEYNRDLNSILYPTAKDRDELGRRLDAVIPKNSEIFDIIDEKEFYKKTENASIL